MSRGRSRSAGQLPLSLPHRPATSRADFVAGRSNRVAIDLIDAWPAWPERGVFLFGPPGSGKSHLVDIWRQVASARVVAASDLDFTAAEAAVADGALAVEDIDRSPLDERTAFHLLNLAAERATRLLVTSRTGPADIGIRLADLASRLRAFHPVEITGPDDGLLRRVLVKLFADRQLAVDPGVIDYVVVRMERSFEAASSLVARLDRRGLAERRPITRQLAGAALAEGEASGRLGDGETDDPAEA